VIAAAGALAPAGASAQGGTLPGGDAVTSDNVEHLGKFPQLGDGVGGRVVGNIFYATSTTGLFIFDISDPGNPKQLGNMTMDVEFENEDVPTNGKILGISASTFGVNCETPDVASGGCLNLYDVSDPAAPSLIKSVMGTSAHTMECVFDCTWFYGSEGQIVDARDPKNAKMIEVNWADKAIEQGYEVTQVSASPHDVTEVAPGYVVTSSQPMVLMSLHPEHGGAPDNPVVIASGNNEDMRFIHSTEWPRQGKDKFLLVGGESVLGPVGNGGGPCSDEVAAFMSWDASKAIDGKGGFLRGGSFSMVDEVRPYNGAYVDGGHPDDKFGCSVHWFKPHPTFRNGGEVAVSMYEHGTRIFNVSPEGKLTEVDYALPIAGAASAPYWAPDGKHFYTADYQRGMDIWVWNGTPKPGPEDKNAGGGGSGGGGNSGGGGGTVTPPTPALSLTVGKLSGKAKKGFKAAVACSRACDLTASLTVDKKTAKKLRLGKKAVRVARSSKKGLTGKGVLTFKVSKKVARKLRKGTKLTLAVSAKAADGRSASARRTVKAG
jgi:hypothetical protein